MTAEAHGRRIVAEIEARKKAGYYTQDHSARRTETNWEPSDYRQALKDALLVACGETVKSPHPLAAGDVDPAAPFRLSGAVDICLANVDAVDVRQMPRPHRIIAAMGSQSDLPNILTEVAQNIAVPRVNRTLRKFLAVTSPVDVPSYHSKGFSTVDIGNVPELTYFEFPQ